MSPIEYARSDTRSFSHQLLRSACVTHLHPVTLPMCASLGSVQLRCEAGAARRWPGSRAAYLIASVTASHRSQIASRGLATPRRQAARRFGFGTGEGTHVPHRAPAEAATSTFVVLRGCISVRPSCFAGVKRSTSGERYCERRMSILMQCAAFDQRSQFCAGA